MERPYYDMKFKIYLLSYFYFIFLADLEIPAKFPVRNVPRKLLFYLQNVEIML